MVSDLHLLERSLQGNTQAFGALVERYKNLVCAVMYSATGNHHVSEELAQEAFITAWRNLRRLETPEKFKSWVAAIARNIAGDWLRKHQRERKHAEQLQQDSGRTTVPATPREAAIASEQAEFLWRALEAVPETYRLPLVLYYREGRSVQAVAAALDLSESAVKQRLLRGRAMLKGEVARTVETALERTKPDQRFTLAVLQTMPRVLNPGATIPAVSRAVGAGGMLTAKTAIPLGATVLAAVAIWALTWHQGGPESEGQVQQAALATPSVSLAASPAPEESAAESANVARPDTPPAVAANGALASPAGEESSSVPAAVAESPVYCAPAGYPGTDAAQVPGDAVRGTVYGADGRPAAHAKVWAARFGEGPLDNRETVTDADGRYGLRVSRGQWRLRACRGAEGGEGINDVRGQFIAEGRGDALRLDVRMKTAGVVTGRIIEDETGEPIPGARILADTQTTVSADEDGRYLLEGMELGRHTLFASAPGRLRRYVLFSNIGGPEFPLDIRLPIAGKVRGRVVDEGGHPVAYAWVKRPASLQGVLEGVFAVCDERGRFEYDGLKIGQQTVLQAMVPCYNNVCGRGPWVDGATSAQKRVTVTGTEVPDQVFILQAATLNEQLALRKWPRPDYSGVIRGSVTDPRGRPVREFRVLLQRPNDLDISTAVPSLEISYVGEGFSFTSDDGSFALSVEDFRPGQVVRAVALAAGYGQAAVDSAVVQPLWKLDSAPVLRFVLTAGHQLNVRVVEDGNTGSPIAGATVQVIDGNSPDAKQAFDWFGKGPGRGSAWRSQSIQTDSDGWARFRDLPFDTGAVAAFKETRASARAVWPAGVQSLFLRMAAECSMEGEVRDKEGAPVKNGSVCAHRTDGEYPDACNPRHDLFQYVLGPEDGGHFRLDGLPAGHYEIRVIQQNGGFYIVGYYANGEPVIMALGDQHLYVRNVDLEPGDTFQVVCPGDSDHLNVERWLTENVSSQDGALRDRLLGTWVHKGRRPDGLPAFWLQSYSVDGRVDDGLWEPHSAAFKVSRGELLVLGEDAEGVCYGSVEFPGPDTMTLVRRPANSAPRQDVYVRAKSLELARAEGQAILARPDYVPYTHIKPVRADSLEGMGTFGGGE